MRFQSQFTFLFILIQETSSVSDFFGKRKIKTFGTQDAWILASSRRHVLDQILTLKKSSARGDESQMLKGTPDSRVSLDFHTGSNENQTFSFQKSNKLVH